MSTPDTNPIQGKAPIMVCPHCSGRAYTRTVRHESEQVRTLYYACSNVFCGHTFAATLAISHEISPPSIRNTSVSIPPAPTPVTPARAPAPPVSSAPLGTRIYMLHRPGT